MMNLCYVNLGFLKKLRGCSDFLYVLVKLTWITDLCFSSDMTYETDMGYNLVPRKAAIFGDNFDG